MPGQDVLCARVCYRRCLTLIRLWPARPRQKATFAAEDRAADNIVAPQLFRGRLSKGFFDAVRKCSKSCRIPDRNLGQRLPVQLRT
jgi:hypothetical protein